MCVYVCVCVYPIQFTQFGGAIERKPEEVSWGILAFSFCFEIRGDFCSYLKASFMIVVVMVILSIHSNYLKQIPRKASFILINKSSLIIEMK